METAANACMHVPSRMSGAYSYTYARTDPPWTKSQCVPLQEVTAGLPTDLTFAKSSGEVFTVPCHTIDGPGHDDHFVHNTPQKTHV